MTERRVQHQEVEYAWSDASPERRAFHQLVEFAYAQAVQRRVFHQFVEFAYTEPTSVPFLGIRAR